MIKKILGLTLMCLLGYLYGHSQNTYNATIHTTVSKPLGLSGWKPTDARSAYYDPTSFTYRPYQDTIEVLSYLNNTAARGGNFPIYVKNSSGNTEVWWFRDGTADSNLVLLNTSPTAAFDSTFWANQIAAKRDTADSYSRAEIQALLDSSGHNLGNSNLVNNLSGPSGLRLYDINGGGLYIYDSKGGESPSPTFLTTRSASGISWHNYNYPLSSNLYGATFGVDSLKAFRSLQYRNDRSLEDKLDSNGVHIYNSIAASADPLFDFSKDGSVMWHKVNSSEDTMALVIAPDGRVLASSRLAAEDHNLGNTNLTQTYAIRQYSFGDGTLAFQYYGSELDPLGVSTSLVVNKHTAVMSGKLYGGTPIPGGSAIVADSGYLSLSSITKAQPWNSELEWRQDTLGQIITYSHGVGATVDTLYKIDTSGIIHAPAAYSASSGDTTIAAFNDKGKMITVPYSPSVTLDTTSLSNRINSKLSISDTTLLHNQIVYKVDKVSGKGLSTNDYTTAEKTKLSGIEAGAEQNVNADWNASSGDANILNKPNIAGQIADSLDNVRSSLLTSIGISVPTGLQVSNSPLTANGTIAITFQSGYSIPTTAKQTSWDNKFDTPTGTTAQYIRGNGSLATFPTVPTNNNQLTNGAGYMKSADLADSLTANALDVKSPLVLDEVSKTLSADTSRDVHSLATQRQIDSLGALIDGSGSVTNLAIGTKTTTTIPITNSNGTGFTLPSATTSLAGLLSSTDKTRINGLAAEISDSLDHVRSELPNVPSQISDSLDNLRAGLPNVPSQINDSLTALRATLPSPLNFIAGANITINQDGDDVTISASGSDSQPLPDVTWNNTSVTSDTLALTDKYQINNYTSSSAVLVKVPTNASVAFPVGTRIVIRRGGTGSVTITPLSGVTIESPTGTYNVLRTYGWVELDKRDTNTWALFGDL